MSDGLEVYRIRFHNECHYFRESAFQETYQRWKTELQSGKPILDLAKIVKDLREAPFLQAGSDITEIENRYRSLIDSYGMLPPDQQFAQWLRFGNNCPPPPSGETPPSNRSSNLIHQAVTKYGSATQALGALNRVTPSFRREYWLGTHAYLSGLAEKLSHNPPAYDFWTPTLGEKDREQLQELLDFLKASIEQKNEFACQQTVRSISNLLRAAPNALTPERRIKYAIDGMELFGAFLLAGVEITTASVIALEELAAAGFLFFLKSHSSETDHQNTHR